MSETLCGLCQQKKINYDYLLTGGLYRDELKSSIKALKYQDKLHLLEPLASLLLDKLYEFYQHTAKPKALLAMPLHPSRLKQRGYNQALELAKILQQRLSITLLTDSCMRTRNTKAQSELSEKERFKNVKGAFSAKAIGVSHLAIVDDVVTTGASINQLSLALKKQNPHLRIDAWCLAKA